MAKTTDKSAGEVQRKATKTVDGLTPKEEAFAHALVKTGCQSTAYRMTTKVGKDTRPETIWQQASTLANRQKVRKRVVELQEQARKNMGADTEITLEKVTGFVLQAIEMAAEQQNPHALSKAAMDLGKLHGLVVEKSETKNLHINLSDILRDRFKSAKSIDADPISS